MSNILREKNFNVRQFSHTVRHKAHVHAFGLRVVKAMVLAQWKLFYVKESLITDYSKAFYSAILGK
jgi:hypothetical protein